LLIRQSVVAAQKAIPVAMLEQRAFLIAFVFAMLILSVVLFFTLLYKPWPYIWAYIGASLRIAVAARHKDLASFAVSKDSRQFRGKKLQKQG
jgi:hypothetical protein